MRHRHDYYGNDATSFEVFDRHDHLEVIAESVVELSPESIEPLPAITWEEARQAIGSRSDGAAFEASEFVYHSPFVPVLPEIGEFARAIFSPQRQLFEAAQDLTHRIYGEFKYLPQSTSVGVPLSDVMRHRRGVCQDFAHVMIAALRSQGLAARYVSGYVRPAPKVQGAQASHAWVSIFFPGTGWISFDPTNDLVVLDSHITLAWGRDYGDVTPVKGISLGGGGQTVNVEVYVRAAEA
jgi:transglutaminase-like putative cysteine protease